MVANYISSHPNDANRIAVFATEGSYLSDSILKNNSAMQILRENNVPIIAVGGTGGTGKPSLAHARALAAAGLNAYYLKVANNSHVGTVRDLFADGVPQYVMGLSDVINNSQGDKYLLYKYNPQTGKLELSDLSEIQGVSVPMDYVMNALLENDNSIY